MFEALRRPRLTRFEDVATIVGELRRMGVSGPSIYGRMTEIGPVDLDLLNEVLDREAAAGRPPALSAFGAA
jgi:hypothetical protein